MPGLTLCLGLGFQRRKAGGGAPVPQPLQIAGTPVLTATQGATYAGFAVTAHFGTPPYAYSLVGAWPAGVSINSTTGVISGTPTVAGSFAGLSVRVTDAASDTADLPAFTLPVAAAVGHRHWRIVCTAGSGGYYSLTEVLMRSELGGSVNLSVAANGVATASGFPNSTYSPDKAIDGDAATSWTVLKAVGMWWKFSFTAPQAIEEVEIFANSAESVNHPTSFRIEHSDDDATWTVWKTVEGIPAWGAGTGQRRIFNNGGGTELPRHWRFVFTEYLHGTYVNVEGVQFRSTSGGPNRVVFPGGSATGNKDTVSGTNPGMAFDGIANTGWEANHSSTTSVLQWTQPPGHGIDVTEYLIGPGPFANEAPKAWSLQWSRNGYTWQTSDTRSGQTGWTANTPRTFSATTTIGA